MSLNSLQDDMSRRAASMAAMAKRARNPQEIQAIQKSLVTGVQNGSIQPYVGIPLIQELTKKLTEAKAQMAQSIAGAGMPQAPQGAPIAQQVMQQAAQEEQSQGLEALPSNLPQEYAGGGIIAFEEGGEVERYQNAGLIPNMSPLPAYSATNPNAAMGEFLKKLGISTSEFANARPEVQKNILDMFKNASEAPKPMATPTVTPAASTPPSTSGSYRAGQAVGQAVRGGASGTGNFLSRGLMDVIGGRATGAIGAFLTPSPIADDQAVLAALRGEGYRGQPYDVISAREILKAAGMDPNKAPVAPAAPAVTPYDPSTATRRSQYTNEPYPTAGASASAAPAIPGAGKFVPPVLEAYKPTILTLPERKMEPLTDLGAITKDMDKKTKIAAEDAVTKTQKIYEDMDKPGFEAREARLGKREVAQEKDSAMGRALNLINLGFGIAGSKERSVAGALGKEGREGIADLIRGEAANRAAKDKLEDYRDNLEQQKIAAKKGNYQAAQAAGERAADNLYKYTNLNLTASHYGNTESNQRFQIQQQGDINKLTASNQGEQIRAAAVASANQNKLGVAGLEFQNRQLNQQAASANAQLQLGRERLGILKDQIAAGDKKAQAILTQAEIKAASTWQSSPDYQKAQAQAQKMAPVQAQEHMQREWLKYKGNMLPSLMGGSDAGIPSFSDLYKATE